MVFDEIENKLQQDFAPSHLEVINESYMHNVPKGSESHFKVIVVSDVFEGMTLIQKHRAINESLKQALSEHIHALSIHAYTPTQWQENPNYIQSPQCEGGNKL